MFSPHWFCPLDWFFLLDKFYYANLFSHLVLLCVFVLVSWFPGISATGEPPLCVPCLFNLVKERFILSKRWSLLVLHIIVFYPLWILRCTIKLFLTYSQCLYIPVESFLIHPKCTCWSVGTVLSAFWLIFICNILRKSCLKGYIDGAEGVKFGTFHLPNRACFLGSVYKYLAFCGIIEAILLLNCYIFQPVSWLEEVNYLQILTNIIISFQ